MAVAIRTITRLQDADDAPSLGAGQNGYALTWDNGTSAFVATALVADHGALTGLADDDHTQYLLATGARTGASSQAQTFTNGIIGPSWKPASDSTTALQVQNAAGTAVVTVDTSNKRLELPFGAIFSGGAQAVMFDAIKENIFFGASGNSNGGNNNIGFGTVALGSVTSGVNNFAAGYGALYYSTTGSNNFALGIMSMAYANPWSAVAIGNYAGQYTTGGNSVFIGYMAGNHETGSQRLYIDSLDRSDEATGRVSALVYGEFNATVASQLFRTNGVFQQLMNDSATSAPTTGVKISHNTSGTAANGFGSRVLFELESSTTADQSAAAIKALWNDATHATRKADLVLTAYDSGGEREGLRIRGNGSAPAIGFFGTAPAERPTGVAVSAAGIHAALVTLGLITA